MGRVATIVAADRATWLHRARNGALVFAAFVVVVALVGFLVVPRVAKPLAERQIGEALGRKATIGALHFNPFLLAATIDDFTLYEADGTTVFVKLDGLLVDASSASLFRRALVLDRLAITRPQVHIVRLESQRFNFSDIVDRLADKPKSDSEALFSLNNIELDGGSIDIDDRVAGNRHRVEALRIALPFVSNLPYDTDIFVTPAFAATIDGSAIAAKGRAQPFSVSRETAFDVDFTDLDLPRYADLAKLPFKLVSGKLSAKLALTFRAASHVAGGKDEPQSLALAGHVGLAALELADTEGRNVVGARSIDVDLTKIDPFNGIYAIAKLALVEPSIDVTRRADGSFDLVELFSMPKTEGASPAPAPAKPPTPPQATIADATLTQGRLHVVDETLAPAATTTLEHIELAVTALTLAGDAPAPFKVSMAIDDGATFAAEGRAAVGKRTVDGSVTVKGFKPARVAPYLASFLAARIDDGSVDVSARYRIDASGATPTGVVDDIAVTVDRVRTTLVDGRATSPLFAAERVALDGGRFDLATRAFAAEHLTLTAPAVTIRRDAAGALNLRAAIVAAKPVVRPVPAGTVATAAVEVQPVAAAPFTATLATLAIERGDITVEDLALAKPLKMRAQPFDLKATTLGTTSTTAIPFSIDTTLDKRGKLSIAGKVTVAPLFLDATIAASDLPVGPLVAYAGDALNVVVETADLNARGTLRVSQAAAGGGTQVAYVGSFGVARMRALDRATSDEFVRWKTLAVPTIDLRMSGANAPLAMTLGTVALDDFYARVIVNANGRLNLQDVLASSAGRQSVTAPEADPEAGTVAAAAPPPAPSPKTRSAAAPAPSGPKPLIRVAGVKLSNGRIGITDNFIKPNYSATLTDLAGTVAAIASDNPQPAALKLSGKIDGEGTLDVGGTINPLAPTLYLDIASEAKDIELTRLSPYAIKYAGYGIERGRLSTTLKYHIENGRLTASNRLFLDQLTFGAHDPDSKANLPVRLAVALLANSKGEIDIDLPVSGTLSDPEFSIGGVLWRALVNLVVRAVTSPFSVIGAAFGGGSSGELGYIQFKPGVSDLTDMGKSKLETLGKALAERPALKLDIIGRYDPATDPDGIKRDHLLDRLKDAKAKDLAKGGAPVDRADIVIEPGAEYAMLLARVYGDTKLPDKPRNAIGLAKDLPDDEMERLLVAAIPLAANDPRWLAEARADVVRHYIEGAGRIPPGRVFLVAPKLDANGIADAGAPNRVDFALR